MELGGKSTTKLYSEVYLVFHLKISVSHLWFQPYSTYQTFLFETIKEFRQRGWNFKQIAELQAVCEASSGSRNFNLSFRWSFLPVTSYHQMLGL
ncbi:MAG: hypothetical protein P8L49_08115, partial [Opitutaceae bacterium]|nr:hypothetical protein [Opitutaceae bacterium]